MADEEQQPLIGMQKKLQESKRTRKLHRLKYSCEEIYERMDNGLCLFCEELDTPGHHQLKHKGVQIFMTESYEDQVSEDKEEAHQIQETASIPEETVKSSGPFIDSLKRASALQVPDFVTDVLIVHKMDSHVKEVEEFPQQSTNDNGKNTALKVFDEMPLRVTSKEKQRKSLKAWRFKFKPTSKRSRLMDDKFSFVEATVLLNKDPQDIIWDCVNKEFKETVAGCGKKRVDPFKLIDEIESRSEVLDQTETFVYHQALNSDSTQPKNNKLQLHNGVDILLVPKMLVHDKEMAVLLQRSTSLMINDCPRRLSRANHVWKPGGVPTEMDLWDWPKKESKSYQGSHQSFDRKKSNKTLYLEDEYEQKEVTKFFYAPEVVLWFNSEKMDLDWFFQRDLHKLCLDIRRMIILLCLSADYRKLKVWVDTNYCEIRPDKTHVKLQEMSCFLSEKSLVEFVGYKAHGRDLLVVGVKQFTLAATKFHLKHKWRSKFGSNKLTRTWTSYSRYDSSSCALRKEENYVLVLFIIIEALTLFNDQHTLVAEKNGTETSIVLKLIFGTSQNDVDEAVGCVRHIVKVFSTESQFNFQRSHEHHIYVTMLKQWVLQVVFQQRKQGTEKLWVLNEPMIGTGFSLMTNIESPKEHEQLEGAAKGIRSYESNIGHVEKSLTEFSVYGVFHLQRPPEVG